ncbi:hypothetical protein TYRP_017810, partial [Tyrophagus putrescentiae]
SFCSVTYEGIGTFGNFDFYHPIYRPFTFFFKPDPPEEIVPTFTLYTRSNPHAPETLIWNDTASLLNSKYFNSSLKTKVLIHGFLENSAFNPVRWLHKTKTKLLNSGDYNVILVDWDKGSKIIYDKAVLNARVIGPMIAIQIQRLCDVYANTTLADFHLISFSLGCHVAGYAGKFLEGKLGWITGLDPSRPLFEGLQPEAYLYYTDASFVEVLHTDSRLLIGLGFSEPTGKDRHIYKQWKRPARVLDREVQQLQTAGHLFWTSYIISLSIEYYLETLSLSSDPPQAFECASFEEFEEGKCTDCGAAGERCVFLGLRSIEYQNRDLTTQVGPIGRFFIKTNEQAPYFGNNTN